MAPTYTLFADDFDAPRKQARVAEPDVLLETPKEIFFSQEQLDQACEIARADGYAEGAKDAAQTEAAKIAATLQAINERLENAADSAAAVVERNSEVFAKVLFSSMLAGFPLLQKKFGGDEIRGMMKRAMPGLVRETAVTFEVHPSMVEVIESELSTLSAKEKHHMTIETSDEMSIGDVKITWQHGAAIRNSAKVQREISAILIPLGLAEEPAPTDSPN
jgi:flagellar biosynthesis/type III secretory pathway protein FliH